MRLSHIWLVLWLLITALAVTGFAQAPAQQAVPNSIHVILLGTGAGPPVNLERYGPATLVQAGSETLLFDCGRGALIRLAQAGVSSGTVNKVFLTHLHSDHIIDLPDLFLTAWSGMSGRKVPLEVWGPAGTRDMMMHLEQAFAFDIHIRRDVDEKFSPEGIKLSSHDVEQGTVFERNGVKVTAFLVDHGPVKPALGYRVDYGGHSVAISGDTRPSDTLVRATRGVDVLMHEGFDEATLRARAANHLTEAQILAIAGHHTTPEQAGEIFTRVKPRLAVFYHISNSSVFVPKARKTYDGPLEVSEDLMTIDIGDKIEVKRPGH